MHFVKKEEREWIRHRWLRFLTIRLIKKGTGNEKNSKIKKIRQIGNGRFFQYIA